MALMPEFKESGGFPDEYGRPEIFNNDTKEVGHEAVAYWLGIPAVLAEKIVSGFGHVEYPYSGNIERQSVTVRLAQVTGYPRWSDITAKGAVKILNAILQGDFDFAWEIK